MNKGMFVFCIKFTLAILASTCATNSERNEMDKINERLSLTLADITKALRNYYDEKINNTDIYTLRDQLPTERESLESAVQRFATTMDAKMFLWDLQKHVLLYDITLPWSVALSAENLMESLEMLKSSTKGVNILHVDDLVDSFNEFISLFKYLREYEQWYLYLESLFEKLNSHEFHINREKYNVRSLKYWGSLGNPQGLFISTENFHTFLNYTAQHCEVCDTKIVNTTVTSTKIEELNSAIEATLKKEVSITSTDRDVLIKGISMDILQNIPTIEDDEIHVSDCNKPVMYFSLYKVFFGTHFSCAPIYIIAPEWEVVAPDSTLKLQKGIQWKTASQKASKKARKSKKDGQPGNKAGKASKGRMYVFKGELPKRAEELMNSVYIDTSSWQAIRELLNNVSRGEEGSPGEPGVPGGTFFGIGERFLNGHHLKIVVDGADGQPGHDGGDGANGFNMENKEPVLMYSDYIECRRDLCKQYIYATYFCKKYDEEQYTWSRRRYHYILFNDNKIYGGSGGNGGRGGIGGFPGFVHLFEMGSDASGIKISTKTGKKGPPGMGGKKGLMGKVGRGRKVVCEAHEPDGFWWFFRSQHSHLGRQNSWVPSDMYEVYKKEYNDSRWNATDGIDGENTIGIKMPGKPAPIAEPCKVLNQYKRYLRQNLHNRFLRKRLLTFLKKLNSDERVNSLCETEDFLQEFEELEADRMLLNKEYVLPFYEYLVARITEHEKDLKQQQNNSENLKVLTYMKAASTSSLLRLVNNSTYSLAVNISSYLNAVQQNVEALRNLQVIRNKAQVINQHKDLMEFEIKQKLKEAKHYIKNLVEPELYSIIKDIDENIKDILHQIVTSKSETEVQKGELLRKRQTLQNELRLKKLLGGIQMLARVGTVFLGEIGSYFNAAKEAFSFMHYLIFENNPIRNPEMFSLKEALTRFDGFLDEVLEKLADYPEESGETLQEIMSVKNKLSNLEENTLDLKEFRALEKEVKQELRRKKEQLTKIVNKEQQEESSRLKTLVKTITKFRNKLEVSSTFADEYQSLTQNDEDKIHEISYAISNSEREIQIYADYEDIVRNSINPLLKSFTNDTFGNLESKSDLNLMVVKWQLQKTIRELKFRLRPLASEFRTEKDLFHCIETLEEALNILIYLYDRMQTYQLERRNAHFVAEINSAETIETDIPDPELATAVYKFQKIIISNAVVQQYKTAIDAFKQWMFPFAENYLHDFIHAEELDKNGNLDQSASKASELISLLKAKVDLYRASVTRFDSRIVKSEFYSHYVSSHPYFVWRNEQFRRVFHRLFSGSEVALKSDIRASPEDKDAIKFNFVRMFFKTRDARMQQRLDEALKGFDIEYVHQGNSYYRFQGKVYTAWSVSQRYLYSFEENGDGEPIRRNNAYVKMKSGDLLLSPYASWKIKLLPTGRNASFDGLAEFANHVDLELSGYGNFVKHEEDSHVQLTDRDYWIVDPWNRVV